MRLMLKEWKCRARVQHGERTFPIIFDTVRDQNGFVFGTNAAGVKYDGQGEAEAFTSTTSARAFEAAWRSEGIGVIRLLTTFVHRDIRNAAVDQVVPRQDSILKALVRSHESS